MSFLSCGKFSLDLRRPLIMGVLNVTPDSFSDGGRFNCLEQALERVLCMVEEGVDIVDIGGESTRPGAAVVSVEEEIERVIPVIAALRSANIPLSIDTSKPEVMKEAIKAGVSMVNDINALQGDALEVVANSSVAVCLMHKQGNPQTMQLNPSYDNVVDEVYSYLAARALAAQDAGIDRMRIVLDPGFGFGKNLQQNIELLRALPRLAQLGLPLLVGLSRKSMLGQITGKDVSARSYASIAAALFAVERGANIVRVHDVDATRDALLVWNALTGEQ